MSTGNNQPQILASLVYLGHSLRLPLSTMQLTSELNSEIAKAVAEIFNPDKDDRQRLPTDLKIKSSQFEQLVSDLCKELPDPKLASHAGVHRQHLSNILLNLSRSVVTRRWTVFFSNPKVYSEGGFMQSAGFSSRARTTQILDSLVASNLVIREMVAKYQANPKGALYFPGKQLREKLYSHGLDAVSDSSFKKSFIRIDQPDKGWKDFDPKKVDDYDKIAEINEYAKKQVWACKEAITRIFFHNPATSGRLNTEFQNLPSRFHKIRGNTLINGEPITEVEFNANHFRIFLAFNKTDLYGDSSDAYRPIADLAKVDRQTVKSFLNAALNSETFDRARSDSRVPKDFCLRIIEAFERLYPNIKIFDKKNLFGAVGMKLEGEMLQIAIRKLMLSDVFALPVGGAIAVNMKHKELARLAMEEAWEQVMHPIHSNAKTFVG